jgi:hypothetical protein
MPHFSFVVRRGFSLLALSLAVPTAVQANVGPPSSGGQVVGEPIGIENIAIQGETLHIDLQPLAADGLAQVEATYRLRNDGETQQLDLLFAGGAAGVSRFEVWLDDEAIPTRIDRNAQTPESWKPPSHTPSLQPGQALDYLGYVRQQVHPVAFQVTIPPGEHALRVRYVAEAARHQFGHPTMYRQFAYILAPARSWADFGGLTVEIQVPDRWRVACEPALPRQGNLLAASFNDLPADAICLTLQAPPGPWHAPTVYGSLALLGLALLGGAVLCWFGGRTLGRRPLLPASGDRPARRPPAWPLSLVLGIAWSAAVLVTGLLALFGPSWALPAHQASQYGYGKPLAMIGVFLLTVIVFPVGFSTAQITASVVRHRSHATLHS